MCKRNIIQRLGEDWTDGDAGGVLPLSQGIPRPLIYHWSTFTVRCQNDRWDECPCQLECHFRVSEDVAPSAYYIWVLGSHPYITSVNLFAPTAAEYNEFMCCRQRAHSGDQLGGEEEQRLGSVSVLSSYEMLSRSPWRNVQHTVADGLQVQSLSKSSIMSWSKIGSWPVLLVLDQTRTLISCCCKVATHLCVLMNVCLNDNNHAKRPEIRNHSSSSVSRPLALGRHLQSFIVQQGLQVHLIGLSAWTLIIQLDYHLTSLRR